MRATQSQDGLHSKETSEIRKDCKPAIQPHTGQFKQTAGGARPRQRLEYRLVCKGNLLPLTPDPELPPSPSLVTPPFLLPPPNSQLSQNTGSSGNVTKKKNDIQPFPENHFLNSQKTFFKMIRFVGSFSWFYCQLTSRLSK